MPHLGYFEDKEAPNSGRPDFGIYVSDRESGPGPESTLVLGSGPDQRYQEYPPPRLSTWQGCFHAAARRRGF